MDQDDRMAKIRSKFSEGSAEYDARIRTIVPRYEEMLEALVSCITTNEGSSIRAIDLGCGTGALSEKLLEFHPEAELTCLDMTASMLDLAKERLMDHPHIRYVLSDIYDFEFDGPYNVVMSSLALHHVVTDQDKKLTYQRIYDALGSGGSFYNADLVLGSDEGMQGLYMRRWVEFMCQSFPREEIDSTVLSRYRQEDSPARLVDHLQWLKQVGFCSVDVAWKHYGFAVYGGRKD